jgi:hypothetical protein
MGFKRTAWHHSPGKHQTSPALRFAAWTATLSGMKWRAFWAGVKHDVGALLRRKPDGEGYIPAWDPSIPKHMSSYGPPTGQDELRPVVQSKSAVGVGREPGVHHHEFVFDRGARRWSYAQSRTSLGGPDLQEVVHLGAEA